MSSCIFGQSAFGQSVIVTIYNCRTVIVKMWNLGNMLMIEDIGGCKNRTHGHTIFSLLTIPLDHHYSMAAIGVKFRPFFECEKNKFSRHAFDESCDFRIILPLRLEERLWVVKLQMSCIKSQ